jgi:hypothetical protein
LEGRVLKLWKSKKLLTTQIVIVMSDEERGAEAGSNGEAVAMSGGYIYLK